MNAINFKHSIIFFNLCILISPFYMMLNYEPIILCLFTILIIGVSHGSLDNIKGEKLLKSFGYKSVFLFYFIYLIISILIIILWLIFPNTVLLLFLIVAAYHFGKEDTVFSFKKKFFISEILFFFKGSTVIIAPLLFQRDATNAIFKTLNFYVFESSIFNNQFLIVFLILGFLSSVYISNKKNVDLKAIMIIDFLSLIVLNFFLTPVIAFTLYFCFLHSIRHSITLIFELDKLFKKGFKKFLSKAIPLTFVTGMIFLIAIYFLNNFYRLDEAIYKVIFIGLASLTFPHILLEYLLEKNEKKT
ncbi:Brp/Blh family beta-carotene 15,15'-dioxygenase [Pelagibacteraceae bacterium]|jgi:Brp/Blh family beta-carotene 15,15'-monooxygenase|nr:Brp/Blh family beta-carotene 15,15'-dioxygenase [Pelagibacteraceae bacterium]|tara:strand:- start:146 stop:1051 length:906 start_codon:yes stop_codon:yes gene_type:complete